MRGATLTITFASLSLAPLLCLFLSCSAADSEKPEIEVSSRSYKGHEGDIDANNLAGVFPSIVGTRLDDCQACHSGKREDRKLAGSSCDNCHDLLLHGTGHLALETLNGFGRDYLLAGRSKEALESILEKDSDGDGFSNEEEISTGRFPGSEPSMPGQAEATALTVTLDELQAVPSHSQFMLINTERQRFDDYVTYEGIKVKDLLDALNIDLSGATGITLFAPDGYRKSLPIEYVFRAFPQPLFYSGLDVGTIDSACGFVRYAENVPDGLADGTSISGEHWLMLGYKRDGVSLDPADLDVTEGDIQGDGPFRVVVPQEIPGVPDRGSEFSPSGCGDGFDFKADADHNAGAMVRGVIALRIDPMPVGVEEFDYMNGGWSYVDAVQLIIYGHGVG